MPTRTESSIKDHLNLKLREELSVTCIRAGWASILLALLYQIPFFNYLKDDSTNWWIFSFLILSYLARTGLGFLKIFSDKKWLAIHTAVITMHTVCWSALLAHTIINYQTSSNDLVLFIYILFAGLNAAASYGLSVSRRDFYIFITPILITQTLVFFVNSYGTELKLAGPFTNALFFIFLSAQRKRTATIWIEQRKMNFELQNIIDAIPGGISILRQGRYEIINKYVKNMESKNNSIIGTTLGSQLKSSVFAKKMWDFIKSDTRRVQFEADLKVQDTVHTHLVTAIKGLNEDTIISTTDIHELKQIELAMNLQKTKLAYNAKMAALGEMSGGLAHEINNPVAIISGRAQQMILLLNQESVNKENLLKGLKDINTTAERINRIVKSLRSLSNGDEDTELLSVNNLKEIVDATLSLCEVKFKNHGIVLENKVDADIELTCRRGQISQVIMNALNNSYDAVFALENKWIHITTEVLADNVYISITDSGSGISEEVRKKIMQPFFSTKDIGNGTGLGLSVSKGIIESHKGELFFNYDNKQNTQLVISLPLHHKKTLSQSKLTS
jgi:signal transduction histidine kinase